MVSDADYQVLADRLRLLENRIGQWALNGLETFDNIGGLVFGGVDNSESRLDNRGLQTAISSGTAAIWRWQRDLNNYSKTAYADGGASLAVRTSSHTNGYVGDANLTTWGSDAGGNSWSAEFVTSPTISTTLDAYEAAIEAGYFAGASYSAKLATKITSGGIASIYASLNGTDVDLTHIRDRAVTENDVVSTSSKTTLYSFSVPGGMLGTNRGVRVVIIGDYLNDTGSNKNLEVTVAYGSTTMWGDGRTIGASATRRAFMLDFVMGNRNSASVQHIGGKAQISGAVAGSVAGVGDWEAGQPHEALFHGSAAENSANTLSLTVSVTHSASNASLSIRREYAFAELI